MAHFITFILSTSVSLLMISSAIAQESAQLYKICRDDSKNYTKTSSFSTDLNNLLDTIYTQAPSHQGFWKAKDGEANGIGFCRGDVPPDYCDFCLYDARCKILQRCSKKRAIVWFDYCTLRYADYNFFGEIDSKNRVGLYNVDNATDAKGFNATTRLLLRELSAKAIKTDKMFSFGTTFEKKENATIYGMAQCGLDLSKKNCSICLAHAVRDLPGFTTTTTPIGGRTLTGSCNVRYEIYPFLYHTPPTKNTLVGLQIYHK